MAEYIRFVSYLYEYEGNEKKKNVGFVRYEVRCGQKKLVVVINGSRQREGKIPVYAFYREMDSCIGISLGAIVLKGGRGSFQYSTYAPGPSADDDEVSFEKVAGIMVTGEGNAPVFATVWDDEEFLASSFVRNRQELVRVRPEPEPEIKEEPEVKREEAEAEAKAEIRAEAVCENETEKAPASAEAETKPEPELKQQPEPERVTYELYRQTMWDKLCKIYPKVMPFPYNISMRALRIRPGDLGRFPKENWALAKNSFILHGFFQYRYIIVVRIPAESEEYEERYMIGVPGVFSQMDNYLAEMFGFHEFFGSPRKKCENGTFGFWMQEITMER